MAPKEPRQPQLLRVRGLAEAVRPLPWAGTPYAPLLRKLVPRQEPWASDPDSWYSLVYGEVQAIAREIRRAGGMDQWRTPHGNVDQLRRCAASLRRQARAAESDGEQEAAKLPRVWAERFETRYRAERAMLPPPPGGNRAPKPASWRIVGLLSLVREVTGKPRHRDAIAALLWAAGVRPPAPKKKPDAPETKAEALKRMADALKMIEWRAKRREKSNE